MSELRLNLISREWVVIASENPRPPESFRRRGNNKYIPEHDPQCPFCPGNEDKTPQEILRIEENGRWLIRVAPNKYSVLTHKGERMRTSEGYKRSATGVGSQEVIIENPAHNTSLAAMSKAEAEAVLRVYKDRFSAMYEDRRIHHTVIFKNHGASSGTTLRHPHTQIIGFPVIPLQVRFRIDEAMRHYDDTGACLMCGTLADELSDGTRIILESRHFVAFIPYAALSPFHMWIFPRRHMPSFSGITDDELADLADTLRLTLKKLHHGLDDPDYNFVFVSTSPYRTRSGYLHWYISIVPHVMNSSGIELGTGMRLNQTLPEQVARYLRGIEVR